MQGVRCLAGVVCKIALVEAVEGFMKLSILSVLCGCGEYCCSVVAACSSVGGVLVGSMLSMSARWEQG